VKAPVPGPNSTIAWQFLRSAAAKIVRARKRELGATAPTEAGCFRNSAKKVNITDGSVATLGSNAVGCDN
jgi:hypothetical protein